MVPGVIAVKLPTDTEFFDLAHDVFYGDPHFGDLMIQLAVVRVEPAPPGAHPGKDHFVLGTEFVQARIPSVAPETGPPRQARQEPRLLEHLHVVRAPARGCTEMDDPPIRGHRDLGFQRVCPLLPAEELLLVLGPTHGLLPRSTPFVLLGLPAGLFGAVDDEVSDLWEGFQHVFKGAQATTRDRIVRDDLAAVQGPGPERSRQRLLQEREQRMNVAADVGGIHLEQHAQEVHREVVAQVQQGQEETVGNVEFERATGSDLTLTPDPQEGKTMSSDPERVDLLCQVGELRGIQAAERLEGPRTLHEALHLKHAVTLHQSPQLRNES